MLERLTLRRPMMMSGPGRLLLLTYSFTFIRGGVDSGLHVHVHVHAHGTHTCMAMRMCA